MNEEEYQEHLVKSLTTKFISDFEEKTGLKISIYVHSNRNASEEIRLSKLELFPIMMSLEELEDMILNVIPYKTTSYEFKSKSRKRELVDTRSIFTHIARRFKFKYVSIGKHIKRDHSTVIHLEKKASDLMETDDTYLNIYTEIINKIKDKYDQNI